MGAGGVCSGLVDGCADREKAATNVTAKVSTAKPNPIVQSAFSSATLGSFGAA
jgi:hypothetical protein